MKISKNFFVITILYFLLNYVFHILDIDDTSFDSTLNIGIINVFIAWVSDWIDKYCMTSPDRLCRAMHKAFYTSKMATLWSIQASLILCIFLSQNNYDLLMLYVIAFPMYTIIAMWYSIKIVVDSYYIIKYIVIKLGSRNIVN